MKAFGYHQAGNLKESCDYYLRLANVSKNKTKAYLALAQIYLEMRDHASAISYIEKLINRKSGLTDYELAELYSDTALCHAYLGHTENGYKYINQALELNEHDAEIRIAAGRFFTIEAQKAISAKRNKKTTSAMRNINSHVHWSLLRRRNGLMCCSKSALYILTNIILNMPTSTSN